MGHWYKVSFNNLVFNFKIVPALCCLPAIIRKISLKNSFIRFFCSGIERLKKVDKQ